ncbi:Copia protein [Rhizoctonia solani]|uniref:Copia protein n=1 Tax=Rhizoctonia solani TaxID=456999 RepID=A0A8H8NYV7_9AGAM|nr:Copia protein [Rhizoctonia solani]QRW21965.1 Copia protein [Rhizoctonia solani]
MIAAAAHHDFDAHIIDITGAYTHAPIDQPLYVEFPEGFGKKGPYVMRLKKALYSAHQSGYLWEQYRNNKIDSLGYTINPANISVFTRNKDNIFTMMIAYVDDFLICCLKGHIDTVKSKIMNLFNCKDLGKAKQFVGILISRNRPNKTITLTNKKYIKDIIKLAGMTGAPHALSPMSHTHPVLVPKEKEN